MGGTQPELGEGLSKTQRSIEFYTRPPDRREELSWESSIPGGECNTIAVASRRETYATNGVI